MTFEINKVQRVLQTRDTKNHLKHIKVKHSELNVYYIPTYVKNK